MSTFGKLNLEDNIYNWLVSYFKNRTHTTKMNEEISDVASINASVVQGSTIGPSSFSIAESDLRPKRDTFYGQIRG